MKKITFTHEELLYEGFYIESVGSTSNHCLLLVHDMNGKVYRVPHTDVTFKVDEPRRYEGMIGSKRERDY